MALYAARDWGVQPGRMVLFSSFDHCNWFINAFGEHVGLTPQVLERVRQRLVRLYGGRLDWSRMSVVDMARAADFPALVVHDEDDEEIPFEHALALAAVLPRGELRRTRGYGHHLVLRSASVIDEGGRMKHLTNNLALVLGSGGVRSVAALGITQRLAEEGIRPGLIAGCSSGALFGATIAMGLDAQEALRLATRLWSQELTQQRRWRSYVQMILPRLAGFGDSFAMRDDALIAQRIADAFGDLRLEQLPTPLRVATTHAVSGDPVVLK
eukprot:gene5112-6525_t